MYIAMPFIGNRPALASAGYFRAVESILQQTVCKEHGWGLKTKDTCVRLQINDRAHIDVPLYGVRSEKYNSLVQDYESAYGLDDARLLRESLELGTSVYKGMSTEHMMLAHRQNGWQASHPKLMQEWFDDAVDTHGEVLRRVCRYLKGWRDFQWEKSDLGSIALMACVVKIFDENHGLAREKRDDITLLEITRRLSQKLAGPIWNPVIVNVRLDDGWSPQARNDFQSRAQNLYISLEKAITNNYHKDDALRKIQGCFGKRIPNDVTLIVPMAEAQVLNTPQEVVPAPIFGKTTSG